MENSRELYLDLMKRCLTNAIYGEDEYATVEPTGALKRTLANTLQTRGVSLMRPKPYNPQLRTEGRDWPPYAHTMIGHKRLDNIQYCIEQALKEGVSGDMIETGVWRGGGSIFMRAVLKAYAVSDRMIWVADSFEGLPKPNEKEYPSDDGDIHHTYKELVVPIERVQANFAKYGLLDEQVRFLKGWFCETLPTAPISQLAVMRLDGDMYASTMDALISLYDKLSVGGFVIVDDWSLAPCRQAVHDFRAKHSITDEIVEIDWTGVYWRRSR